MTETSTEGAVAPRLAVVAEPVGRPDRRLVVRPVLVLAAALVLVSGVALVEWRQQHDLAAERATRIEVAARSSEFGEALLSYDFHQPQQAKQRVLRLTTGDFARYYTNAFDNGGLGGVITNLQATATATVRAVYVGDVNGNLASSIVVVDSEITSKAGVRKVTGSHLEANLIRTDGRWLISEVTSIGATDETMTGPDGKPVPPTPTPAR
jgi:Mce-associated membrane protein